MNLPERMYINAADPSVSVPLGAEVTVCLICFALVPKALMVQHEGWHVKNG